VTLLDERVTQLERSGLREPSAAFPYETDLMGDTRIAPATRAPQTSTKPSTTSSIKPSTREIQQALKNAGFYQGSVDGKAGPLTSEAVREFQRVHGLKADGVVGKKTWAKLSTYANLTTASGELNAAEILK